MADGTDTPPIRWLFERLERRRRAIQYWVADIAKGLLLTAVHEALKVLPIDACSAVGAMLAKNASRRYAELDARARENENLKQLRPERSDPASVDAAMSRLWRSVARTRAELSVLDRLWRAGRITVEGVEHLDAARAANRPILGVVLHLGNWEAMGVACLAIGYPVAALYMPEPNRFEERLRAKMQRHHGAVLIPPGFRAMRVAVQLLGHARRGVTARHYIRRPDATLIAAADCVYSRVSAVLEGGSQARTTGVSFLPHAPLANS